MAVSSTRSFDIDATPEQVMAALAAVERLPEWSSTHKSVTVESTHPDGRPHRVRMTVSIVGITDEQVVEYSWNGDESMSWTLVESSQQRQQDGAYTLTAKGSGTTAEFGRGDHGVRDGGRVLVDVHDASVTSPMMSRKVSS